MQDHFSPFKNLKYDFPAAVVVVLVALPLCLGIALASGAPLFSGIIAGVVGGIVIGALSKSPLSVSGPAAGLTVIVFAAIQELPSFEAFLLAVCLAGALQVGFGLLRAGIVGDFIPSTVIKGMLAAIGLILILKQLPHALGYDKNAAGYYSFQDLNGYNTFSTLWHMFESTLTPGAIVISVLSLIFLFWWDKRQYRFTNALRFVPGPLVVVLFGIGMKMAFDGLPDLRLEDEHLVAVPISASIGEFVGQFRLPDFSLFSNAAVWTVAFTLAVVASLESLLSIEAVDKLDPFKRVTPTNRELMAQGIGNICSGMIGGLPVTSVIVRSSANVTSGGRTKSAAILHGIMLFGFVVTIPKILNLIPLSALAAILIAVGYKLTKPGIYIEKYQKGPSYYAPFIVTIVAILLTDLLVGIVIGLAVAVVFIVWQNFRSAILFVQDGNNYLVRCKKDLFFIHKFELKKALSELPDNSRVLIDLSRIGYIDMDNTEIINDFITAAPHRNITVTVKQDPDSKINPIMESVNVAI